MHPSLQRCDTLYQPFLNQSLAIPHIYGHAHHSRRCEEGQLQLKPPSPPPPLSASMLPHTFTSPISSHSDFSVEKIFTPIEFFGRLYDTSARQWQVPETAVSRSTKRSRCPPDRCNSDALCVGSTVDPNTVNSSHLLRCCHATFLCRSI